MNDTTRRRESGIRAWQGVRLVRTVGVSIAALGMLAALAACQQTKREVIRVPVEVPRCERPTFHEANAFTVEAWAIPDSTFDVGEPLRLQMRVSTPANMNVFYVSTSCKVTRLLSNYLMTEARIVDIPTPESGLRMTVKPPSGNEVFYFVATRPSMDFLAGSDIMGEAAGVSSLDLSPDQFYRHLRDALGRINPADRSTYTLRTSIVGG